jgi:hypothetical protein
MQMMQIKGLTSFLRIVAIHLRLESGLQPAAQLLAKLTVTT